MESSSNVKNNVVIVRQDVDNKIIEGVSVKKMLKIFENINSFQCFSKFTVCNGTVKIVIRPPEQCFETVMEFIDAIELRRALNSVSFLASAGHFMLRIKIKAVIYEKDGEKEVRYTYNNRILTSYNFDVGGSTAMTSEKFLIAKVKKIEKLILIGGEDGCRRDSVFCSSK